MFGSFVCNMMCAVRYKPNLLSSSSSEHKNSMPKRMPMCWLLSPCNSTSSVTQHFNVNSARTCVMCMTYSNACANIKPGVTNCQGLSMVNVILRARQPAHRLRCLLNERACPSSVTSSRFVYRRFPTGCSSAWSATRSSSPAYFVRPCRAACALYLYAPVILK